MAINVGSTCSDRAATQSANYTLILTGAGAAGAIGTINTVNAWVATAVSGFQPGAASPLGGLSYGFYPEHLDNGASANITAGSCQQLDGDGTDFDAFTIFADEYCAFYFSGGTFERTSSGGAGVVYYSGDALLIGAASFTAGAGLDYSCNFEGTEDTTLVDMGGWCSNWSGSLATRYTCYDRTNPANQEGSIDTIFMWAATNMSGVYVGAATRNGAGDITISAGHFDSTGGFSVTAGSCVQLDGDGSDFDAYTTGSGEITVFYPDAGTMEYYSSLGGGIGYKSGNYVEADGETGFTEANGTFAMFAIGATAGGSSIETTVGTLAIGGKTLFASYTFYLDKEPLAITGKTLSPAVGVSKTLTKGTLAIAGKTVGTILDRSATLVKSALTITGKSIQAARTFYLAKSSLTITGKPLTLTIDKTVSLVKGTLSVTGKTISAVVGGFLTLTKSALAISGKPLTLGRSISLVKGSLLLGLKTITTKIVQLVQKKGIFDTGDSDRD